jgi:Domain of unknown function (DUF5666)
VTNLKLPTGGTRRVALGVGTLAIVSLLAAACGTASAKTSAGTDASASATSTAVASPNYASAEAAAPTTTPSGPPAAFRPAASGTIASITGSILEVQNPQSGQTTVNVSSKTVIAATVSVGLSDVKSGGCISATGTKGSGGSIDATNVMIFSATKGTCLRGGFGPGGGFGGGGRGFPRTTGGTFPTRTSGTGGRTFKRPANFANASGKVTSVAGSKIKVDAVSFTFSSKTKKPTTTTSAKTVSVSKSTKYSKSEKVASSSLKVGECVTATGSTNSIGAVAASTLIVTQPTSSGCSTFGGFGGFGRGGGSSGGGSTGGAA